MASYFNRRGITPKTSIVPDIEMKAKFTAFRFIWTHSATCTDHSCCKNYCWNTPATWVELCNTSLVCHECQQVASMIVETLRGIRAISNYTYSGQRWSTNRELSTWMYRRYIEEEKRPCVLEYTSRKQRKTSIVRNTSKPTIPSSPASRTGPINLDIPCFVH